MEEIVQISTDKNVLELIELMKKNQMEREAANIVDLVSYIDVLSNKLEMMNEQLSEMHSEVARVRETQDRTMEAKLNRAEDRIMDSVNRLSAYMVEQTQLRIDSLKRSIQAAKNFVVRKSKEIVAHFKKTGKKALFKVSEFLKVRHVLDGMKNSVEIGIQETNDIITRIDDFGKDIRETRKAFKEARDEGRNALRSLFGKGAKDVATPDTDDITENDINMVKDSHHEKKTFSKLEAAKKPWRWQRGVYENIKLFLETSIEKIDSLDAAVRKSIARDSDFEKDERIFSNEKSAPVPVVAEQGYKYGADAFEDYIKAEGIKGPVVETTTPKPLKR